MDQHVTTAPMRAEDEANARRHGAVWSPPETLRQIERANRIVSASARPAAQRAREFDLPRYATLRDGGLLPSEQPSVPWPAVILIAAVITLFIAFGLTMAPRVVASTAACAADGCAAWATADHL